MSARSTRFNRPYLGIFAVLLIASPVSVFASDVIMAGTLSEVYIDYDPFKSAPSQAPTNFSIENRTDVACSIDSTIVGPDGIPLDGAMIAESGFHLRFEPNGRDFQLNPSGHAGVWRAELQPKNRYRMAFVAAALLDAVAPADQHSTRFGLELCDVSALSPQHSASPLFVKSLSKPPALMNISGSTGSFGLGRTITRIDFGELVSYQEKQALLQVRAHTKARLTISSENLGFLKLDGKSGAADGIAYQSLISGQAVDLSQAS